VIDRNSIDYEAMCMAYSAKLNYKVFECITCEPLTFMLLTFVMCVRVKF